MMVFIFIKENISKSNITFTLEDADDVYEPLQAYHDKRSFDPSTCEYFVPPGISNRQTAGKKLHRHLILQNIIEKNMISWRD